jgi:protein SCO1/2
MKLQSDCLPVASARKTMASPPRIVLAGCAAWLAVLAGIGARPALAQSSPAATVASQVGIDQRLGQQVPLELEFFDERGRRLRLGKLLGDKPVVLNLVYYECPMLCGQVLYGTLKASQAIPFRLSADYQIITVSFDPRETPALAAAKKRGYVASYAREGAEAGWHFLTGDEENIRRLAESVGFRYHYLPESDQYAHASGIVVLTPDGKISRYFYGIDYNPLHLRMALVESSQGTIGSAVDQFLLLCYHYDPLTGQYGLVISWVLKLAGILTVVALGTFMIRSLRQERRGASPAASTTCNPSST